MAVNEATNRVYVANAFDDSVSVIQDAALISGFTPSSGSCRHPRDDQRVAVCSGQARSPSAACRPSRSRWTQRRKITATVPANATSGAISVTTPAGTSTSAGSFTFQYAITVITGPNGSMAPAGSTLVNAGASQAFTITPAAGYKVADVLVDGASVGGVTTYTFTNVTENHSIVAVFTALPPVATPPVTTVPNLTKTKVSLGTPVAPKTMKKARYYTVYGFLLKPKHAGGTRPVWVNKYKKVAGKWRSYGYVKASAYNYGSYTRYKVKLRLPSKGSWRLRALAPADAKHLRTWSARYDYVTVK